VFGGHLSCPTVWQGQGVLVCSRRSGDLLRGSLACQKTYRKGTCAENRQLHCQRNGRTVQGQTAQASECCRAVREVAHSPSTAGFVASIRGGSANRVHVWEARSGDGLLSVREFSFGLPAAQKV